MKNRRVLSTFVLFVLILISCEKEENSDLENQINSDSNDIENLQSTSLVINNGCNGSVSGSFTTLGQYHKYSNRQIDVSCAEMGSSITVRFTSGDVPNRFILKRPNGSIIKNTGWMGDVNFPGPWGFSLNNRHAPKSVTFTKTSDVYTLEIETVTSHINQRIDQWSVSYLCTCDSAGDGVDDVDDGDGGVCVDNCGDNYGGNFNQASTYYIYPARTLNVECVDTGETISIFVNPADVPNRFRIKDANGNTVLYSNWLGTANYPGPWGFNLFSSATYLTFQKSANSDYYTLIVETATPSNQFDSWSATLNCQ